MAMVAVRRCLSKGATFTRESAAVGFRSTWGAREAITACCSWVRAEASARTKSPATTQPDKHALRIKAEKLGMHTILMTA